MLEDSVLNEMIIKTLLKEKYGLNVKNVKKINKGSANIYNLDDKYILKEYSSNRSISDIEKEYNVIDYLDNCELRVPKYLKSLDGKCYVVFNERIIIIQIFLAGFTTENNTGDYEKIIESATILGKISKALENYDYKTEYDEFPTKSQLLKGVEKLKLFKESINSDNPHKDVIISDINKKINIMEQLEDFNFDELQKVTLKLCHGDYSVQQLIYNDKLGTAVIDFETVKCLLFGK